MPAAAAACSSGITEASSLNVSDRVPVPQSTPTRTPKSCEAAAVTTPRWVDKNALGFRFEANPRSDSASAPSKPRPPVDQFDGLRFFGPNPNALPERVIQPDPPRDVGALGRSTEKEKTKSIAPSSTPVKLRAFGVALDVELPRKRVDFDVLAAMDETRRSMSREDSAGVAGDARFQTRFDEDAPVNESETSSDAETVSSLDDDDALGSFSTKTREEKRAERHKLRDINELMGIRGGLGVSGDARFSRDSRNRTSPPRRPRELSWMG